MALRLSQPDMPIDVALVLQHRQRATPLLHAGEGLLLFSPANILGFIGVPLAPSDRLVCGLVNQRGEAALVCPDFEKPAPAGLPPNTTVWPWLEHEDAFRAVASAADYLGISHGTILLDPRCWLETSRLLAAALPRAQCQDDRDIIARVRLTKSPQEIDAIAAACGHVGSIYAEIGRRIKPGVTEIGLAASAIAALPNGESLRTLPLVQTGPNAALPHRPTGERPLAEGDGVIVDYYVPRRGYWGD